MQVNVFETHLPPTTYLRAGRAAIAVKSRSVVNFTHLPLPLNVFRFRFVYQNRLSVISPTTDPVDCHRLRSVSCYFYKFTHNNYAYKYSKSEFGVYGSFMCVQHTSAWATVTSKTYVATHITSISTNVTGT